MTQMNKVKTDSLGILFTNNKDYDVSWITVKTERDLAQWIVHMKDKNWFDNETERQFIAAVCQKRGFNFDKFYPALTIEPWEI